MELKGFERHLTDEALRPRIRWAGIYSRRPLSPLADPHPASATAVIDGATYCSTILPWRGCPEDETWPGNSHAEQTVNVLDVLVGRLPIEELVWGGDWNHALSGMEQGGSKGGQEHVLAAVKKLGLQVSTADLPHWIDGHLSIDHIAVGSDRTVTAAWRIPAKVKGVSDHDCYVLEVDTDA